MYPKWESYLRMQDRLLEEWFRIHLSEAGPRGPVNGPPAPPDCSPAIDTKQTLIGGI